MVTLDKLKEASLIQLKNWAFALGYHLKSRLHGNFVRYASLYKDAKDNLGCKSLVFGLDKYERLTRRQDNLGYFFGYTMLTSLEVTENKIRYKTRRLQPLMQELIHSAIGDREWADVTTNLSQCKASYSHTTKAIAAQFWDEEKTDILLVLSDALEDDDALFEANHLRVGHHGPACPIIQRIVKGIV